MARQRWTEQGGPEDYRRRLPFIHARSFVTSLSLLQRSLRAMCDYDFGADTNTAVRAAYDAFTEALPGLRGVRDSTTHAEDRTRGKARGRSITPAPIKTSMIDAPHGGVIVMDNLVDRKFGCTTESGEYAEVELSDATTEVACAAVQAVYDVLPWRPGHRLHEPVH